MKNSPKVATYDLQPEMSAFELAEALVPELEKEEVDFVCLNFANGDMVGHTGIESAAIKAVEAVDECVGKAVDAIKSVNGVMFICADHGNAEQMSEPDGSPFTAHTTNRVPLIYVNDDDAEAKLREDGKLCDLSPTILDILELDKPEEMTGTSLIIR